MPSMEMRRQSFILRIKSLDGGELSSRTALSRSIKSNFSIDQMDGAPDLATPPWKLMERNAAKFRAQPSRTHGILLLARSQSLVERSR